MEGGRQFSLMVKKMSISIEELQMYNKVQLKNFFPDSDNLKNLTIAIVTEAIERTLKCFSRINNSLYQSGGKVYFNHCHGDQYATYLYFLSRVAFENKYDNIYYKSALLNKALHGIDLFGHVEMPKHFLLVHPVGTIIGRGKFEDFLCIYQGVTIGGKHSRDGNVIYPTFGENVTIFSNSSIIGNTEIGTNCIIGANTNVLDGKFKEPNRIILGNVGSNSTRPNKNNLNFFTLE